MSERKTRGPSLPTKKALYNLSNTQCSFPGCTQSIAVFETPVADPTIVANACHIRGRRPGSARWDPDYPEDRLDHFDNLILLCPNHHKRVDSNPERFPVEELLSWKRDSTTATRSLEGASTDPLPAPIIDGQVQNALLQIRQGRFLTGFDTIHRCLGLSSALREGDYSGGTTAMRCQALAWCARLLAYSEESAVAKECLETATELGHCDEVTIAAAFLDSAEDCQQRALATLSNLDSPESRSAALMVALHHGSHEAALEWMGATRLEVTDLDPDGKLVLLASFLDNEAWDGAKAALATLTETDFEAAPVLNHLAAMIHLLSTAAAELRPELANQPPYFFASAYPLAASEAALEAREAARRHFAAAADTARELGCPSAATIDDDYILWLELLDPARRPMARTRLEASFQDLAANLRLVPLALQFDVPVDLDLVNKEIDRAASNGASNTPAIAMARLAIATMRLTPGATVDYIRTHRDTLSPHVDNGVLSALEISALAQAGRVAAAREQLHEATQGELAESLVGRLQVVLDKADGASAVPGLKRRFEETNSVADLMILVEELGRQRPSAELCTYAAALFQTTRSVPHAEILAQSLGAMARREQLEEFLKENARLVERSETLQLCRSWSLFWRGAFLKAQDQLAALVDCQDQGNQRALRIRLALSLGDWESLSALVEDQYREREDRNCRELLEASELALVLGLPRARQLVFACAAKADGDAQILAALYTLATRAGWDREPQVTEWLHEAARLSDDTGPLQPITLKGLVDDAPKWNERRAKLIAQLDAAELPIAVAADVLNSSLAGWMLRPAIANQSVSDPRRRSGIPAYSGKRPPVRCSREDHAAVDATALLTLGFLELLDEVLDAFATVSIPHSTMAWLFDEKRRASFHQPSRLKHAQVLHQLLVSGTIRTTTRTTVPDGELAAEVGHELALLIAEAGQSEQSGRERVVVRPFPVHKVSSLMEQEADLSAYSQRLSGCQPVVDSLRRQGLLTEDAYRTASSFMRLREQPWPEQAPLADSATLYLDSLTLAYFLDIGILDVLPSSGFTAVVSPNSLAEYNDLLSYERTSDVVHNALDRIRRAVSSRIASGRIHAGPCPSREQAPDVESYEPPTIGLMALVERCDILISDDRFLNQHPGIGPEEAPARTISTLDLLDALVSAGALSPEDRLSHRTRLRRAGYYFVPVERSELNGYLARAPVNDEQLSETAELRAIREGLVLVRMTHCLQLPDESPWLSSTLQTLIAALKDQWTANSDLDHARARSDWLVSQIDIRGWAHRLPPDELNDAVREGRADQVVQLLLPPDDAPEEVVSEYWEWVEDRVLKPLKEGEPAVYTCVVERFDPVVTQLAKALVEALEDEDVA